jgi:hypothetical protein
VYDQALRLLGKAIGDHHQLPLKLSQNEETPCLANTMRQ